MSVNVVACSEMCDQKDTNLLENVLLEVALEQGFTENVNAIYETGSNTGDGYSSENTVVCLKDGNKSIDLFVKHIRKNVKESMKFVYGIFESECSTYQYILPALTKFEEERNIKEPFNNFARCYRIVKNESLYAIVLENLRSKNFKMHERLTRMPEDHVLLAFKTFARLHAISFAMKDQNPQLFEQLRHDHHDGMRDVIIDSGFTDGVINGMRHYASANHGEFGEKCRVVAEKTIAVVQDCESRDKYEVFTQGDSWSNNIMFAYENNVKPVDTRLIDFQAARFGSPVCDLSYFFYVVASEEMLQKMSFYQDYYYDELSGRIRELGSDPDVVFPKAIFMQHWIKYGLFGFGIGVYVIKIALFQENEIPPGLEAYRKAGELVTKVIRNEDIYVQKINALFKHSIDYLNL